ncbi:MAG: chromosomal replication initiator protein DnaA [Planctomycetota bacterium]|jgi:chromosomal replication initiator protein
MLDSNDTFETTRDLVFSNIKELVSAQQFRTWFHSLRLCEYDKGKYTFAVPNKFLRDWIAKYYTEVLRRAVRRAVGENVDIAVVIDDSVPEPTPEAAPIPSRTEQVRNDNPVLTKPVVKNAYGFYVNPNYNFDNFVVGPCNQLSYAASLAVAENLSNAYNPLFLHGASGLGKTHLVQSICNKLISRSRNPRINYLSCETFINQFISALEKSKIDQFRNKYRQLDLLLIDDIHLLANKERTQEEFFHTFNSLFNSGKQIVLTSDSYPSEIPTLEERLVSRFKWGLVTQIYQPDFETRCAILKMKARLKGVEVPDEVINYLAENIDTNIRELEGAVTKVVGYATLMNCELNLENACEAMRDVIKKRDAVISLGNIVKITTDRFSVKLSDLQSKKRNQAIAVPRQIAMYAAKKLTGHSLQEIGAYFGGRDHSTVLHAYNKVCTKMKSDDQFKRSVDGLIQELTMS